MSKLSTTVPSAMMTLVTRLWPCSEMARRYPAKLGSSGRKLAVSVFPDGCNEAFTIQYTGNSITQRIRTPTTVNSPRRSLVSGISALLFIDRTSGGPQVQDREYQRDRD